MLEDFKFIGIERDPDYFAIAVARLNHATEQTSLFAA
jgi:DNA modification methylase